MINVCVFFEILDFSYFPINLFIAQWEFLRKSMSDVTHPGEVRRNFIYQQERIL